MSRLCRLRSRSHGPDGQWAYDEITRLRRENAMLLEKVESLMSVILGDVQDAAKLATSLSESGATGVTREAFGEAM